MNSPTVPKNWRSARWVVLKLGDSYFSLDDLELLKKYWFFQWNFVDGHESSKNVLDRTVNQIASLSGGSIYVGMPYTMPQANIVGNLCIEPNSKMMFMYNGSEWVEISS